MHPQVGPLQGLAKGVAVGAGRLPGDDEAAALSEALQRVGEAGEVGGIATASGAFEVVAIPAEEAEDVVLADIEAGVDECLVPLQQQGVQ